MPQVNARLQQISALIHTETPFQRLTGTVYLDAQAVIQWIRLAVFEEVLDLLPVGTNYLRRFRIQDAVYRETVGVLVKRFEVGTFQEVKNYLQGHVNLQIDGAFTAHSVLGKRARALQLQIAIQAGEDPSTIGKRHRGEAETLAIIENHQPDSIFVTADKDAITVARDAGIGHIVRPSAFTAGVLKTRDDVVHLWTYTCLARRCVFEDDYNLDCVDALECSSMTIESADRSPVSESHLQAVDSLDWAINDLQAMAVVLAGKGD